MQIDVTGKCTDMLCLKEGIFNLKKEASGWKIFENATNAFMAVYYDFKNVSLNELRNEMNQLVGDKVLYCFTVNPNLVNVYEWQNIRHEPIPPQLLEIYKSISNSGDEM